MENSVMENIVTPKLSVIVPVYGTEAYIAECLDSLLAQSWKNMEILVVDDGTKDRAAEIAQRYAEQNPCIRVLRHTENKGLFLARVTGLKEMTGDYFAFLDSDDTVTCDYYRLMLDCAAQRRADLVAGEFLEQFEDGAMMYPNRALHQADFDLWNSEVLDTLMKQHGMDYAWHVVWNKVYAKSLRDAVMPYLNTVSANFVMCEDVAFSILFYANAAHFCNVHGEYYLYRKSRNASTSVAALTAAKYEKALRDIGCAFAVGEGYLDTVGKREAYRQDIEQWRGQLAGIWEEHIRQSGCTTAEKRRLRQTLRQLWGKDEAQLPKPATFFDQHAIPLKNLAQEQIKRAIASDACTCVSFDIFDTLVVRPFWQPIDLFEYMEPEVTRIVGTVDNVEFHVLRVEAEWLARKKRAQETGGCYEVTFDEIYQELGSLCPLLRPSLEKIRALELHYELELMRPRAKGKELMEYALAMGKAVICTSDMYLPSGFLLQLLRKCGYRGVEDIFVSCEAGVSKQNGGLYQYVAERLGRKAAGFVHIGDNAHADVQMARKSGWTAFHLPKVTDCMMNQVPGRYYGGYFQQLVHNNRGIRMWSAGFDWFLGNRCLFALAANKLYDDPFVPVLEGSDFGANPCRIGYFALGPYLLAVADWLLDLCQKERFDQISFVARDGYLPKQAFDLLCATLGEPWQSNYIYASRKAIAPLLLATPEGIYSLPGNYNLEVLSPQKILTLFQPLIDPQRYQNAEKITRQYQIEFEKPLSTTENFERFAGVFLKEFYDAGRAAEYNQKVKAYYQPYFTGHCATFDVGYSCRLENVLKRGYGFDVSACYLHLNNSRALARRELSEIGLHTFYDHNPLVTGAIREHMISKLGPSCIGFDCSGSAAVPVFEAFSAPWEAVYVTDQLQQSAMQFVRDLCGIFGRDWRKLHYRREDACLPLEYFLHFAKEFDASLFTSIPFEDDVGSASKTIRDIWQEGMDNAQAGGGGGLQDERLNYYAMSKPKKWLVWLLVDRRILKDTAKRKLANRPALRRIAGGIYGKARSLYRLIFIREK